MNRFAPSATGRAHPGTLVAGLLCWLDARSRGAAVAMRVEDLDPQRCSPALTQALMDDLVWFGLSWDVVERQSDYRGRHTKALHRLLERANIYTCTCSRRRIRDLNRPTIDGGWAYDNKCRKQTWRGDEQAGETALRVQLADNVVKVMDEHGVDWSRAVTVDAGDPIVRRRDGAFSYHFSSVVDDAALGVTRVVRGRDLGPSTAVQCALHDALGSPRPVYRHHPLLLETDGKKLAKFHGAVAVPELQSKYTPQKLCGFLAAVIGIQDKPEPCTPADLLTSFSWDKVVAVDQVIAWDGQALHHAGAAA